MQVTSGEYQWFPADHHILCGMSAVGRCSDNAAMEGFIGMRKRERVNRRRYRTLAEAGSDVFDGIERFHNPRMQRCLNAQDVKFNVLTHGSADMEVEPVADARTEDMCEWKH